MSVVSDYAPGCAAQAIRQRATDAASGSASSRANEHVQFRCVERAQRLEQARGRGRGSDQAPPPRPDRPSPGALVVLERPARRPAGPRRSARSTSSTSRRCAPIGVAGDQRQRRARRSSASQQSGRQLWTVGVPAAGTADAQDAPRSLRRPGRQAATGAAAATDIDDGRFDADRVGPPSRIGIDAAAQILPARARRGSGSVGRTGWRWARPWARRRPRAGPAPPGGRHAHARRCPGRR